MNLSMFFIAIRSLLLSIKNKRNVSVLCKTHKERFAVNIAGSQLALQGNDKNIYKRER